ncbi:glycosyl hydrolase [Arsenicicoccus dermatophilus]|uniref:glycosyl hydrolase n=1 Tax=Arsenicicoccus dermatophilus TaxID=1076331 RepID=UPI003916F87B
MTSFPHTDAGTRRRTRTRLLSAAALAWAMGAGPAWSAPAVSSAPVSTASVPALDLIPPGFDASGAPRPATASRGLSLGVQTNVSWRDYAHLTRELDLMQQAGVPWMRLDVSWASLQERGAGQYSQWYVDRLDRITYEASRRGIRILGTIAGAPSWLAVKSFTRYRIPYDGAALESPARFLAARYAGKIQAWQIWNEPDCGLDACSTVDPADYLPLLKAGYRGVKAGNTAATVVSAGLSGIDQAWLRRFYAAGAKGNFDALALHPYIAPANGSPRLQPAGTNPYRLTNTPAAVQVMRENGDGGKPIWFTEFGWTTGRQAGAYDGVDEKLQAYFLRDAAILVHDNYPQVTHMFWYDMRDRTDSNVYENNFGLLRADGAPKPAYWSLKEAEGFLR